MVWYMNFCMPFLSNDPAINLNRMALVGEMILLLLLFSILKVVSVCKGINVDSYSSNAVKDNTENFESSSHEEKSSVVGKDEKLSYAEDGNNKLKNSSEFKTTFGSSLIEEAQKQGSMLCCNKRLDMADIQNMFPIAFGHHAIAVASAVLYSPFIYQAGAALLYLILSIPLLIAHSTQSWKTMTAIWVVMMIINVGLMMSGLIGVGIANWDPITSVCYGQEL